MTAARRKPNREHLEPEARMPRSEGSLESRRLQIEEEKLELEKKKVEVEKLKAWTTGGSIVISLLIAALTIAFGVWSQHKQVLAQLTIQENQARSHLQLEEKKAKAQFEMKAAEIVMDTTTPRVTLNKAKALLALFPDALPPNFATSFVRDLFDFKQTQYSFSSLKTKTSRRGEDGDR